MKTCNHCGDRKRRKHVVYRWTKQGQWVCDDVMSCADTAYRKGR